MAELLGLGDVQEQVHQQSLCTPQLLRNLLLMLEGQVILFIDIVLMGGKER